MPLVPGGGRVLLQRFIYREDPLQGPTAHLFIYMYHFWEEEEEEEDLYFDTTHHLCNKN